MAGDSSDSSDNGNGNGDAEGDDTPRAPTRTAYVSAAARTSSDRDDGMAAAAAAAASAAAASAADEAGSRGTGGGWQELQARLAGADTIDVDEWIRSTDVFPVRSSCCSVMRPLLTLTYSLTSYTTTTLRVCFSTVVVVVVVVVVVLLVICYEQQCRSITKRSLMSSAGIGHSLGSVRSYSADSCSFGSQGKLWLELGLAAY